MHWIKEVEMVDSVDDLKSSRSIRGIQIPNFEVLDANIASALNRIIHNTPFKKKVSLEEQKAQKEDPFLRGRQIAYLICEYLRVTGANDSVENYANLFTVVLRNDDIQEFDSKWDGILLSMTQIPSDDILDSLYKLRIRESEKLKTVFELYDLEIHQKKLGLDYHRLKTMVKRSIEQEIRNKNFGARSVNFEKNAVVKNQGTKQRVQRILGDCWQWESNGQCVKGDNCSFRHDINKRAKTTQPNPSPSSFMRQHERNASRTRSPRGKSPSGRMSRWPCKDYLKGTCNNSICENGILQNVCSASRRMDADFGKSALMRTARLMNSQAKGPKKNGDKSAVAMLKSTRQLGCVFQDIELSKSTTILRKSSDIRKPIQCVKFTKAVARHAYIRDQNPSLGMICPGDPHQRNPNTPKFEDRSQEETEWQERCAREAAWKMSKIFYKKMEKHETAFFSPSEN